jgi:biotin synthase
MDHETERLFHATLAGEKLDSDAGLYLAERAPFNDLLYCAGEIRRARTGDAIALCAIANARSGACSEDCAFCAQSGHFETDVPVYPMKPTAELKDAARAAQDAGADSFCIVTSGRGPEGDDFDLLLERARDVAPAIQIELHVSVGGLTPERARALRDAGVTSANHNLETSRRFYPEICTTHDWDARRRGVEVLRDAGLEPCSGGLFGMGETWGDRVDLALSLRDLRVTCVPVNFLDPRPGTKLAGRPVLTARDALRILAVLRFILPEANIRTCGGREKILGPLQSWMFQAGASATMLGNYLTTSGNEPGADLAMLRALGLRPRSQTDSVRRKRSSTHASESGGNA